MHFLNKIQKLIDKPSVLLPSDIFGFLFYCIFFLHFQTSVYHSYFMPEVPTLMLAQKQARLDLMH